ncbi:uncharacterized protein LOC123558664 [Mercenaria mercenaria]|uniref:uncharacterized protein LOC123558664 n=1 Tax=Mercenaria mercenaria TaxID=6596 RepID=UPI00234FB370|nr:uncharacterized protein LOC123558664 [Mercenaria mercenaria]
MSDCEEKAAYYLRFISMYIDLGTEIVLKVFVHHTPGKDAKSFLLSDPVKKKLKQLKNKQILNKEESDLVLSSAPHPKVFDISLLITLSINLFSEHQLTPPKKGWSFPPKNSDKSISADLLRLRTIRNMIVGHVAKAQLPKWRFDDEWENVEEIFLRIYRNISPDEESHLKQKMEDYRLRKLDPSIKNKYDSKLNEWHQEISKVQQQVEDAFKTLQDIDKYFKEKSDRYERYIKLLVKGGRFVISAFIKDNIKTHNKTLEDILKEKEDYVRKIIDNQDHLHILYPSDQGETSKPIDMSTWDITLLATVLLQVLDSSSLDDKVKRAINMINTARENYAEAAVVSLHSDEFAEYSSDLKYSIRFLSGYLDQQKQIKCEEILSECKQISKSADAHQTYFDELKNQSLQIKSIQEIYKETVKKTKDVLQEMITLGINFKYDHVLEVKMITLGSDEEKKQLGETVLTEIWREALERSNDSTDFDVVKKEVSKILTEIRKHKEVKGVAVKQKCILLEVVYSSPHTVLDLLNYFESAAFDQSVCIISNELGYLCNTIFTIEANVTLESFKEIYDDRENNEIEHGISIPIKVTSPAAVVQLRSFFKSEAMVNSTNTIADKLSSDLDERVTLKVTHDMESLNCLFDELETGLSSSDSLSDDTEQR